MATTHRDDILLPAAASDRRQGRNPIVAFVPIAIALIGVAAILFGGVSAHDVTARANPDVDPLVTGSVGAAPLAANPAR